MPLTRGFRVFALLGMLLMASACSTPDNSEPPAPLTEIDDALTVDQRWMIDITDSVDLNFHDQQPLVMDGKILTIDTRGLIKQVDAASGRVDWQFASGLKSFAPLSGQGSTLLVSSGEGELVRFELEDDHALKEIWRHNLRSEIRSRALLIDDQVLIRTTDGKLYALALATGDEIWSVSRRVPPLSLTGTSHPAVSGDMVLAGFDNGKLVALERKTGTAMWESSVGIPSGRSEIERLVDLDGQFVVRDGVVYVSSFQGNLVAIVINSGQILWSREFSSFQAIEADAEALYLTDQKSHVWSIDRRTGSSFWKQDALNARKLTAPKLVGDKLVVADLEGYVHFLDKQDGRLVARIRAGSERFVSQPALAGDQVVVLNSYGQLTALSQPR